MPIQLKCSIIFQCIIVCFVLIDLSDQYVRSLSKDERLQYKMKVRSMFYHAYDSYLKYATDFDELMPISCSGMNTWGTFSLSLIDALDTLIIMDNHTEFKRVAEHIIKTATFDTNTNVSVFETNIRVIGGLLSAHLLSKRAGMNLEEGWPCSGPLLRMAEDVARKLLPAFDTKTGMPYGTVNFLEGVPENETPITCTAGVGTFIVEFGTLSRLTGDPIFELKALNALDALQKYRSKLGLLGNHINVQDGKWTANEAGIGAGVDSYFEYLVKGSQLLQSPSLMEVFNYDYELIKNYLKKNDWYIWVNMASGSATMPIFQSLEAFFPGLLTLVGDLDQAKKSLFNYHQVWKQYGFVPEFYDIVHSKHHKREGYPLRPEFIESVLYLYKATKDPQLLSMGADVVDSIYHSARTECGFATIKSVSDHTIEDRMESFFLAETLKYLYLLFDEDNFLHNNGGEGTIIHYRKEQSPDEQSCVIESGGYIFNTEAHPIDVAALSCCYSQYGSDVDLFDEEWNMFDLLNFEKISNQNLKLYMSEPLEVMDNEDDNENDSNEPEFDSEKYSNHLDSNQINENYNEINPDKTYQIQPSFSMSVSLTKAKNDDTGTAAESAQTNIVDDFLIDNNVATQHSITVNGNVHDDDLIIPTSPINQATVSIVTTVRKIPPNLHSQSIHNITEFERYSEELTKMIDDAQEISDDILEEDFDVMSCPSQLFLQKLSLYGQMFD